MLDQRDCPLMEMEGPEAGHYCCSQTRHGQGKGIGGACNCSDSREMGVTNIHLGGGSQRTKHHAPLPLPQAPYFLTECLSILGPRVPEVPSLLLDALLQLPLELW